MHSIYVVSDAGPFSFSLHPPKVGREASRRSSKGAFSSPVLFSDPFSFSSPVAAPHLLPCFSVFLFCFCVFLLFLFLFCLFLCFVFCVLIFYFLFSACLLLSFICFFPYLSWRLLWDRGEKHLSDSCNVVFSSSLFCVGDGDMVQGREEGGRKRNDRRKFQGPMIRRKVH